MERHILKENRFHGDAMLPCSYYHMDIKGGAHVLDCHWHDEMEFLMVTKGKAIFQIETNYYEVGEGEAIFINSGEIHAGFPCESNPCSYDAVVFDPIILYSRTYDTLQLNFIDPVVKNQIMLPRHITLGTKWERETLSYLKTIMDLFIRGKNTYELKTKGLLYLILSELISNNDGIVNKKAGSVDLYKVERLKELLNYIHSNYAKKITIKDLADLSNMSEGHLCRFFKQMTRRSPIDYINYYRVNKAARLLENSDKKIFDIAMDVGIYNFSYFINIFNKYMKCNPSRYRKDKGGQTRP